MSSIYVAYRGFCEVFGTKKTYYEETTIGGCNKTRKKIYLQHPLYSIFFIELSSGQ